MNCRNEFHMKKNVMNNSLTIEHSGHPNNFSCCPAGADGGGLLDGGGGLTAEKMVKYTSKV